MSSGPRGPALTSAKKAAGDNQVLLILAAAVTALLALMACAYCIYRHREVDEKENFEEDQSK